jgi:hypothetical protein
LIKLGTNHASVSFEQLLCRHSVGKCKYTPAIKMWNLIYLKIEFSRNEFATGDGVV